MTSCAAAGAVVVVARSFDIFPSRTGAGSCPSLSPTASCHDGSSSIPHEAFEP